MNFTLTTVSWSLYICKYLKIKKIWNLNSKTLLQKEHWTCLQSAFRNLSSPQSMLQTRCAAMTMQSSILIFMMPPEQSCKSPSLSTFSQTNNYLMFSSLIPLSFWNTLSCFILISDFYIIWLVYPETWIFLVYIYWESNQLASWTDFIYPQVLESGFSPELQVALTQETPLQTFRIEPK